MNFNYFSSFLDKIKPVLNILFFLSGLIMVIASMINNGPYAKIFVITGVFIVVFSIQYLFNKGVEFDFEKKRYRIYRDMFSVKIGKWYSLSGFDRVVFREFSYITRDSDPTDGTSDRSEWDYKSFWYF